MNITSEGLEVNHFAALIALAAIAFLLCVEKGFRGLKLEIS